ncbi:uncharacterized protein MONOS_6751 [Monocercomonoides exilis]|uniref:uncharacterized protein n=1 Tax=Monocercomonoides exilis TaxID=2049356 RepID=UPI00355982B5|nr:hypothetical protein MONOS_6751 [Monocercomonoides exilis]|eukprot:MONOS_6751.1-p1 / transcript=MONOS_6751.1 / gene=MONOS_6751 / organism=Monocercomonoides_exilis_PA203 / gene_product=hypothetical protein PTSG_06777 / transcript_product=hypothetical protein PTSG_06777 / location=Mono_scaffold00218:69083-72236(+) / protein_length=892 / sequence_SO=supercontig / SO=protein_coding / is_pseudo=false
MQFLPIYKTKWGYQQKFYWENPDICHEQVVELDGPFSAITASGTLVYRICVIGDQNAGKSTFFHAFTKGNDPGHLELTSLFPFMSASFLNLRFLLKEESSYMDEPPFIDTDYGRAVLLFTLDDWLFFLEDNNIPFPDCEPLLREGVRYVAFEMIEVGGDHLDSLMAPKIEEKLNISKLEGSTKESERDGSPSDVLSLSSTMLKETQATLYFINSSTLFSDLSTSTFSEAGLKRFLERLQFISSLHVHSSDSTKSFPSFGGPKESDKKPEKHKMAFLLCKCKENATIDTAKLNKASEFFYHTMLHMQPSLEESSESTSHFPLHFDEPLCLTEFLFRLVNNFVEISNLFITVDKIVVAEHFNVVGYTRIDEGCESKKEEDFKEKENTERDEQETGLGMSPFCEKRPRMVNASSITPIDPMQTSYCLHSIIRQFPVLTLNPSGMVKTIVMCCRGEWTKNTNSLFYTIDHLLQCCYDRRISDDGRKIKYDNHTTVDEAENERKQDESKLTTDLKDEKESSEEIQLIDNGWITSDQFLDYLISIEDDSSRDSAEKLNEKECESKNSTTSPQTSPSAYKSYVLPPNQSDSIYVVSRTVINMQQSPERDASLQKDHKKQEKSEHHFLELPAPLLFQQCYQASFHLSSIRYAMVPSDVKKIFSSDKMDHFGEKDFNDKEISDVHSLSSALQNDTQRMGVVYLRIQQTSSTSSLSTANTSTLAPSSLFINSESKELHSSQNVYLLRLLPLNAHSLFRLPKDLEAFNFITRFTQLKIPSSMWANKKWANQIECTNFNSLKKKLIESVKMEWNDIAINEISLNDSKNFMLKWASFIEKILDAYHILQFIHLPQSLSSHTNIELSPISKSKFDCLRKEGFIIPTSAIVSPSKNDFVLNLTSPLD